MGVPREVVVKTDSLERPKRSGSGEVESSFEVEKDKLERILLRSESERKYKYSPKDEKKGLGGGPDALREGSSQEREKSKFMATN